MNYRSVIIYIQNDADIKNNRNRLIRVLGNNVVKKELTPDTQQTDNTSQSHNIIQNSHNNITRNNSINRDIFIMNYLRNNNQISNNSPNNVHRQIQSINRTQNIPALLQYNNIPHTLSISNNQNNINSNNNIISALYGVQNCPYHHTLGTQIPNNNFSWVLPANYT